MCLQKPKINDPQQTEQTVWLSTYLLKYSISGDVFVSGKYEIDKPHNYKSHILTLIKQPLKHKRIKQAAHISSRA